MLNLSRPCFALRQVVLPTFILERRSLLEMYADFFAHPDLFVRCVHCDDSFCRGTMMQNLWQSFNLIVLHAWLVSPTNRSPGNAWFRWWSGTCPLSMQAGKAQWPKNLTTRSWVKSSSATGIFQMRKKKLLHLRWENPDLLELHQVLIRILWNNPTQSSRLVFNVPSVWFVGLFQETVSEGPVPWSSSNSVCFVAEQVSHHPPSKSPSSLISGFSAQPFTD